MLDEARMLGKIVIATMFENHQTAFLEERESNIRNVLEILKCVGRIGKDDVKLFFACAYIFEHITFDRYPFLRIKNMLNLMKKLIMLEIHLNAHYLAATTTCKLNAYAARSSEEVEGGRGFVKVDVVVLKNIEQTFFGEVGCRTSLEIGWGRNVAALVFTSDNAHIAPHPPKGEAIRFTGGDGLLLFIY